MLNYKLINKCLLCQGIITKIIDFGFTPLANEFVINKDQNQDIFPLNLVKCTNCGHVQLDCMVDKERIFTNYIYVTSTSQVNIQHFKDYANKVITKFNLTEKDTVCDIASNDGCFLKNFKDKNINIIGVDPAQNIAEQANKNGIFTIPKFFNENLANEILNIYNKLSLITCNNMLAHNEDIDEIVKGVKILLAHNGTFIFENSYLLDICDKNLIDLVYHEHIHHFHITPLINFFKKYNMDIYDVERVPNHGGSIRVYVCFNGAKNITNYVNELVELEKDISIKLNKLKDNINVLSFNLNNKLKQIKSEGKSIAIYGVPAKATTLCYALNIDENNIDFAVDDNPLKQNTYTPGKHIPVLPVNTIYEKNPDYILVLAWNFETSIRNNHKSFKGKWLVPIPELMEY